MLKNLEQKEMLNYELRAELLRSMHFMFDDINLAVNELLGKKPV